MFASITWEIFFTAVLFIAGSYYGIAALLLYHTEIIQWFRSRAEASSGLDPEAHVEPTPSVSVMGGINQDNANVPMKSSVSIDELVVAAMNSEPETIQSPVASGKEDMLIGSVADLLEEIKTLIQLIAEYRTGKPESSALFNALFVRYPHLQNTSYPQAISFYICKAANEQFSYELTPEEVMTWWNPTLHSQK